MHGVEDAYAAEQRRGTAVTDGSDLTRLTLAAVEGAAEQIGVGPTDGFHRAPEVGRRCLVGNISQLADEPALADLVKALPGELEVVALHVDRPALVADDVNAPVNRRDQLVQTRAPRRRLQRDVGHALDGHVARRIGEGTAVGPLEPGEAG